MITTQLSILAHIQTGPFGSQLHKEDYAKDGTPIVTVEHLGERLFTRQNLPSVSEHDKQRLAKYQMLPGDIIFSRVGSVDRCSQAQAQNDGWLFSGRCLRVRPNKEIDSNYLYYWLSSKAVKKRIQSIAVGATMPSINTSLLGEIEVPLQSQEDQAAVGLILASIDKLIELNQQLNDYLAEFCEIIADKYCKNFDAILDDICFQVSERSDCADASLQTYVSTECLLQNKQGRQKASSLPATGKVTCYRAGDTLVSNIRPNFKKVWYAPYDGMCSGDVLVFRANIASYAPYLYSCLRQDRFFNHVMRGAKGTKMPRGDKRQMMKFEVSSTCGPKDLTLLNNAVKQIATNENESAKLAELRDALLPKLLSGEIDISRVELGGLPAS